MLNPFASIDRGRFDSKNRLFNDYLITPSSLKVYFRYLPDQIEKVMGELPPTKLEIPGLMAYNKRLGAPDPVLRNIELLSKKDCLVIMSGQQPGLLLGPLFTIYKAIQTIKLACQFSSIYKVNFIPVFWSNSEDHDWDEVNHVYLMGGEDGVKEIGIALKGNLQDLSLGRIPLKEVGVDEFLGKLEDLLPETEFRNDCLRLIDDDARTDKESFSEWFSALLLHLLGNYGLVLFDPIKCQINELSESIFRREIEDPLATNRLLTEASDLLIKDGYKAQIHKKASRCNFFLEEEGLRNALSFEGSLFKTLKRDYSQDGLFKILKEEPDRFTLDVVLRPILASLLFPVAVRIAGPSEASYYAQLKGIYAKYNLVMPMIIPRVSLGLMEAKIAHILTRYSIQPWELKEEIEAIAGRLIREDEKLRIGEKFFQAKKGVKGIIDSLKTDVEEFSLEGTFNKVKGKVFHELNWLEGKVTKEAKKRETVLMSRLKRAKETLFPKDLPQERVFNIFSFLVKYSINFIDWLYKAFPLDYTKYHYFSIEVRDES